MGIPRFLFEQTPEHLWKCEVCGINFRADYMRPACKDCYDKLAQHRLDAAKAANKSIEEFKNQLRGQDGTQLDDD